MQNTTLRAISTQVFEKVDHQQNVQKQVAEFESMKQNIFDVEKRKEINEQNVSQEDKILTPPKTVMDFNKLEYIMNADRTPIDFNLEINSMLKHEEMFTRPRLQLLVNNVYIPKFKVKSFSSYMYGGENRDTYNQYNYSINHNFVFKNKDRSRDDVILGIESSFDDSAASLINSFGDIKSSKSIPQWECWRESDGIDPKVSEEKHKENLPKAVEQVIREHDIKRGDKRLKAIAVTIGPGQEKSINVGINLAQVRFLIISDIEKLGEEYGVPVIPVNHLEGHIFTSRFAQLGLEVEKNEIPLMKFPYMTFLATGAHTEIVLNRGVGLHTIIGMSIDIAMGQCFDKASNMLKIYKDVLNDEKQIKDFIQSYNKLNKQKIPDNFFDFLKDDRIHRGNFIELMAKYGDPSEYELPLGFKAQPNCDMTFTGLRTAIISAFYIRTEQTGIPFYEREMKKLNFEKLLNYAASVQFGILNQAQRKCHLALEWCKAKDIPLNAFVRLFTHLYEQNLAGGVSANSEMKRMFQSLAHEFNLPLTTSPSNLCTDNASMIAWTGWELMNAQQEVDIRGKHVNALRRLPLGSYVEGLINVKSSESPNKVSTARENEQIMSSLARKKKSRNFRPQTHFKEINNLFAYQVKDPSILTQKQRINRLYKGMLRKLQAQHVFTIRRPNFDRFHDEQYRVRRDFEKLLNSKDEKEIQIMLEKYELYIEKYYEPYAAMHESRLHSNLSGKMIIYSQTALDTDHIGYYNPVMLNGQPSTVHFHEQYPHMVTAWVYDHKYLNDEFNYQDLEKDYLNKQTKDKSTTPSDLKQQLDQAHKD